MSFFFFFFYVRDPVEKILLWIAIIFCACFRFTQILIIIDTENSVICLDKIKILNFLVCFSWYKIIENQLWVNLV